MAAVAVREGDGMTTLGVCSTLTSLAVGHQAVPGGTEAPVASWRVHALVLAGVSHLTLVDVWWRRIQERPSGSLAQKTLEDTHASFFQRLFENKNSMSPIKGKVCKIIKKW